MAQCLSITDIFRQADEADEDNSDLASDWSEEVLWASPLDSIDVYERFATLITGMDASLLNFNWPHHIDMFCDRPGDQCSDNLPACHAAVE